MKQALFGILLVAVVSVTTYFQSVYMLDRPTVLKLGPVPHAGVLKTFAGEHSASIAFRSVSRVMFYFGSFFELDDNRLQKSPEYLSMFKHIENAVKIDPYNMDAYYFSQAAFTWEVGHAKDVNKVLDYGMKYRTWDYWLPFYAGFNAAYFLKDYEAAAKYMQIAAELSKSTLYTQLAARYFHEAGNAGLGLMFLETMAKGAKEENIKRAYQLRIEAFKAVRQIEDTVSGFSAQYERLPETLAVLIDAGMLSKIPKDPYGGEFYLDETGKVRTSSGFSMMPEESEVSPDSLEMEDDPSQKKGMY